MPGFFGIITNSGDITNLEIPSVCYTKVVCDEKKGPNYYFKRHVIPKFLNDKVFDENAATIIGTDGILFNSRQLWDKYGVGTNFALIEGIYSHQGIKGISEIKGNFSGFVFNKKTDVLHLFTDHVGSKNIFYFFDDERKNLIFGSELKIIVTIMRKLGYIPSLSEIGAYCLLTFGFMIGDNTLVKEIKRIPPGSILTYSNGQITLEEYYKISSTPEITDCEDVIVKKLDSLFLEAIKLEYEKDLEYNYSHIATLSGGLDSRMNVLSAKKLGYSDILCLCFSQSNYLDEKIAKKIASEHGFDFIFHALDNGIYLKDIEKPVSMNDGLVFYAGAAHLLNSISLLEWDRLGILHTGQAGEIFKGVILSGPRHIPVSSDTIKHGAYSTKLIHRLPQNLIDTLNNYENSEICEVYERGVHGVFNGYRMIEHFTEYSSPFLDRDFLDYAIKIPPQLRYQSKIYLKWINTQSPEAAVYRWELTGVEINARFLKRFLYAIFRVLRAKVLGKNNINSMNPLDYWYYTNLGLKEFIETYYTTNIGLLSKHPVLMDDAQRLFTEGTCSEKTQVMTLLAAMKLHSL